MATEIKNACFEYLLLGFKRWYEEYYEKNTDKPHAKFLAEFSRLKSLKLLFLVASISIDSEAKDKDLLDIFDKFYAMQYGPVESDIYAAMVHTKFQYFTFKNRTTSLKSIEPSFELLSTDIRIKLDSSLKALRDKNEELIAYPASVLVAITHKWVSWRSAYMVAQMLNKGSQLMDTEFIRNDPKFFD